MFNFNPKPAYTGYTYSVRSPVRFILRSVNWSIFSAFIGVMALCVAALITEPYRWGTAATIGLVLSGWIFSLCLHEFAHAATAVLGGDTSPSTASYLSFNPFKYLHPVYSIVLPVIFLLLGFLALPGGAVYLRRDLVRSRGWQSAISAAGPLMNLIFLALIAVPFVLGITVRYPALVPALAALAFFEAAATILNLIPFPGLDGFGIIAPWLSPQTLNTLAPFYSVGPIILFFLIWQISAINYMYFNAVFKALAFLHIDPYSALAGLQMFNFLNRGG